AEIVNITGDLNLVPFVPLDAAFASSPTSAPPLESPTPTLTLAPPPADSATPPAPAATMTPPAQGAPAVGAPAEAATGVTVRALNRANVRCGPGIDYLVAGSISSDEVYTVLT